MNDNTNGELEKTRQFARETGQLEQFEEVLKRLTNREKSENVGNGMDADSSVVELYPDIAPYSFFWVWRNTKTGNTIMNGGLIYHGKHDNGGDGGSPTFSVCLEPTNGWSIHT
jgi:hypothetical protein